jgi:hypothetical protein
MSTDNNTKADSPFNMWWVVSGIGVVLVVVALILVLVFGRGGETDNATAPTDTGTSEPAVTGTADSAPAISCDLSENQDIPVAGPEASWSPSGYLLVPSSDEFGPVPLENSEWSCFAHSPTGALFAAAHVLERASGPDYESFMEAAAVDNPSRDAWVAGEDPATHTQTASDVAQFMGFQMTSVETDAVTMKLALSDGDVLGAYTVALVWDAEAGTWKVDMSVSTFFDRVEVLDSLTAFTPWSATDVR